MDIIENLEKLNFTKLEARIYLALLGEKPMSAYQLAKKIDITRPSIYNALDHMLDKGMVEVVPNETLLYLAQEPSVLLGKMYTEFQSSLNQAKKELETYKENKYEESYACFRGFDTAVCKAKEILKQAEGDVYINTDFDLLPMRDELDELAGKGIRVFVFSFYEMENQVEGIDYFSHKRPRKEGVSPSRLMMAVHQKIALLAGGNVLPESWRGMISNNKLFVKTITEHIHNDIYLLKIRDKYGKEIYDKYLFLSSAFEQDEMKQNAEGKE